MNEEYKLIPLKETQSIPVNWTFTQGEYDKLAKGHRSNWCVFLRDDILHFCRSSGQELYRIAITKHEGGDYSADTFQMYKFDKFMDRLQKNGVSNVRLKEKHIETIYLALEEVSGLLKVYFNITTPANISATREF